MANRTKTVAILALMAGLAAGCSPVAGDRTQFGLDRQGAPNMNQSQTNGKGTIPDQGTDVKGG